MLDREIMKGHTRVAAFADPTFRTFVGPRVGCVVIHAVHVVSDLPALCLK